MIKEAHQSGYNKCLEDLGLSDFEKQAYLWGAAKGLGKGIGWAGRQMGLWGDKVKTLGNLAPARQQALMQKLQQRGGSMTTMGKGGRKTTFSAKDGNIVRSRQGRWDAQSRLGKAGTVATGLGTTGLMGASHVAGKINDAGQMSRLNMGPKPSPSMRDQLLNGKRNISQFNR